MGGRRPYVVAREKDWLLARIAEKPDLTPRDLLAELADRGLVVSYYALVWSRRLLVHSYRVIRRMRYGPGSTCGRHDDRGGPSSDQQSRELEGAGEASSD
jgi:hypothetical protein